MGIRATLIFSAALAATSPAVADETDMMELATNLGMLLASEKGCGYTYDTSAIIDFVEQRVPEDDLGFGPMLNVMTIGSAAQIEAMSEASLIAQCTAAAQSARHYGFMN